MDCAACAPRLQRRLEAIEGVACAMANYAAGRCKITYDESVLALDDIHAVIRRAGFSLPLEQVTLECAPYDAENAIDALGAVFGVKTAEYTDSALTAVLWPVGVESKTLLRSLRERGIYSAIIERNGGDEDVMLHSRMELLRTLCISALLTMPLVWDLHPYIQLVLASIVQFWPGAYFYRAAWRSIRAKSMGMEVLVAFSTSVIYIYSVVVTFTVRTNIQLYFLSECVLLSLILFGKYLEALSKNEAAGAIRQLMRLRPKTAVLVRGAVEKEVDVDEITEHDIIRVRPGERVSVDGTILEGTCAVDESMLTGESVPVEKGVGDKVYSGTLLCSGSITMSAEGIGKDSVLEQIIEIVEKAQCSKAPIERFADKIAAVFIPAVAVLALGVFAAWFFFISPYNWGKAIYCLCSLLVIVCPCALGLATPTAIIVASGRAAELGILFRSGEMLEKGESITALVFDKTGTLTYGEMDVTDIVPIHGDLQEALIYAAAIERLSEHPTGRAITRTVGSKYSALPPAAESFESLSGLGVSGRVQGREVLCGARELLSSRGVDITALNDIPDIREKAQTEVLVAIDGELRAALGIADRVRHDAKRAIDALRAMNINVWMMTGDNAKTAHAIGKELGLVDIISEVKPDEKADVITRLQKDGARVCMVGDGINDAPALAAADVSIAMGTGTDVAIEASGIMLTGSELSKVPLALSISAATMRVVRQNLIWALLYNLMSIPAAAAGLINPSMAAAAMSLSSCGVLFNSLRLKKQGRTDTKDEN